MATIAIIFHWPPSELWPMSLDELMDWRERAVALHNKINAPPEK
ncbi:GpE family phage tail protein [Comamonas testosteroni]|uniref:GpE family phage tail protein n=1 Tax=Comamonas testosteroni TaxID=285 RepID=A0A373FPR1_COMTE|nr:GpE family phage tail protein [Comamonas testosteroni]RGE46133.1 GpE family phage tail protein [Comamonas testosteroni]